MLPPKYTFLSSVESAPLPLRVFDSLLMARTRRNSEPLNVSRLTLRAVFSYQHGLKLPQLLMLLLRKLSNAMIDVHIPAVEFIILLVK